MKNLFHVGNNHDSSRFIYNNETPRNKEKDVSYSAEVTELHEDTLERLKALGKNVEGKLAKQIDKYCDWAFAAFEKEYKNTNLENMDEARKLARLMDHREIGGKIEFRTEMVARVNHFLQEQYDSGRITAQEASNLLLAGMEKMKLHIGAEKALRQANKMINWNFEGGKTEELLSENLRKQFKGADRAKLAEKMEKGEDGVRLEKGKITLGGKEYDIQDAEILTGVAMTDIDTRFLEGFVLKNAILAEDGRILAQMENGCEGNLVVLNVEKGTKKKEEKEDPEPEVLCEDCEIDREISLEDITPDTFENWLERISDWEKRGIDRAKIADAIYNYFLMDTPLGKISRRHGLLNLVIGDRNGGSPVPEEYLGKYKSFLTLDQNDQENLTETFTDEEIQKQLGSLQEMHADAVAHNGVLSAKYRTILEAQMQQPVSDEEFRNFGERLRDFTWETLKQSFGASLAASAVATLAAGTPIGVAVVFVEFFRSTIGAETKLEMASVRKLDLVAEHARLYRKYEEFVYEKDGNLHIYKSKFKKAYFYDLKLLLALDKKITGKGLTEDDQKFISQYLSQIDKNKCYAQNLYQTAFSSKETVKKASAGDGKSVEALDEIMTDPVRKAIEERRKTYAEYRQEVGEKLFDSVEGKVDAHDIISQSIQRIGEFLGMGDRADTVEEAYSEINEWLNEYEEDHFEFRDGKLQPKKEFIDEMKKLKEEDPEEFDEEMQKLDLKNKEYLTALQLRSQLFNASKLAIPREGSVIFTQSADILDQVNDKVKEGDKLYKSIKPSVDKYLEVVSQVYESLDPVIHQGSGFSIEEMELDGDAHLSYVLGKIRENVEILNKAMAEGDKETLAKVIGNINQATEWQSGNESTYESVYYLQNVVLPTLQRNKPKSEQVPEWVQRNREEQYKEESPHALKVCEMAPEDYMVIPYIDDSSGMPIGWAFEVGRTESVRLKEVKDTIEHEDTFREQVGEEFNPNKEFTTLFNEDPTKWTQEEINHYMNNTLGEYFSTRSVDQAREILARIGANPEKFIEKIYGDVTKTWTEEVTRTVLEKTKDWAYSQLKTSIPGIHGGVLASKLEHSVAGGEGKGFDLAGDFVEKLQAGNEVKDFKIIEGKKKVRSYGNEQFEINKLVEVTFTRHGQELTAQYLPSKDGKKLYWVEEKQWQDGEKELIVRDESASWLKINKGKIEVKKENELE